MAVEVWVTEGDAEACAPTVREVPPMEDLTVDELLEALPQAAALCDEHGILRETNSRWADFRRVTGRGEGCGPGCDLLAECDADLDVPGRMDAAAGDAFRAVALGETSARHVEYAWTVDGDDRWYRVEFTALTTAAPRRGVLLSIQDVTSDRRATERLAHLAHHDALTGLPNRTLFFELYPQLVALSERRGESVYLLFCDLDRFKDVNSRLGHQMGDELLRAVASRLTASLRPSDVLCRFGGDEFLVLLPDVEGPEVAEQVARRLIRDVSRPFRIHDELVEVGLSVGIALAEPTDEPGEVLRQANEALFRAKEAGRSCTVLADEERLFEGRAGLRAHLDLTELSQERMLTYFQPIVDLTDGSVVGVESLLRWSHPQYGVIPAGEFLALAVNAGLMAVVSEQALQAAASAWVDLRDELPGPAPKLFVNLSPEQLATKASLDRLHHLLIATGLPPEEIVVEITEEAMTLKSRDIAERLDELTGWGLGLAVDDFGAGYSSLGRLRHLPVEVLKLDQSLLRGVEVDPRARQLLASIGSMASELGVSCVVEGCESESEAAVLADLGFRFAQGFHLGRPMPADALRQRLQLGVPA